MTELNNFDKEVLRRAYKARLTELKREIEELYSRANGLGFDLDNLYLNGVTVNPKLVETKSENFVLSHAILGILESSNKRLSAKEIQIKLREKYPIIEERFIKDREALRKTISSALVNLIKTNNKVCRAKEDNIFHYSFETKGQRRPH